MSKISNKIAITVQREREKIPYRENQIKRNITCNLFTHETDGRQTKRQQHCIEVVNYSSSRKFSGKFGIWNTECGAARALEINCQRHILCCTRSRSRINRKTEAISRANRGESPRRLSRGRSSFSPFRYNQTLLSFTQRRLRYYPLHTSPTSPSLSFSSTVSSFPEASRFSCTLSSS